MSSNNGCVAQSGNFVESAHLDGLVDELRQSRTFDDAADLVLRALSMRCDAALRSRYPRSSIQRAILHLRPEGGHQGIRVRHCTPPSVDEPSSEVSWVSSLTAWRYVAQNQAPFEIDVEHGQVTRLFRERRGQNESGDVSISFEGQQTLSVMRARNTTHVLVLPVEDVRGNIVGQACLEVQCSRGMHSSHVWLDALPGLRNVLGVGAPYVTGLSEMRSGATSSELSYPVVGLSMRPVLETLRIFARHRETLLLQGPTGTGKSRLARWCHLASPREDQPFVVVTLNSVPSELQASTLFGWRKGAFTGATHAGVGAVHRARAGTLFLDEVDKLDLAAQKSLLRLLEERTFQVIGGDREEAADVRFIVGTNADLEAATKSGAFLPDLYYRINVLPVRLPPLAERADEIVPWAQFMVRRCASEIANEGAFSLSEAAGTRLAGYSWPGNLRQLDNVVRRSIMLALAEPDRSGDSDSRELSTQHIERALDMEHSLARAPSERADAMSCLRTAARTVVARLMQVPSVEASGAALDVAASGFRGLMLLEAVAQSTNVEEAMIGLGKERMVRSRNHQRSLQAAQAKVAELRSLLEREGLVLP